MLTNCIPKKLYTLQDSAPSHRNKSIDPWLHVNCLKCIMQGHTPLDLKPLEYCNIFLEAKLNVKQNRSFDFSKTPYCVNGKHYFLKLFVPQSDNGVRDYVW